MLVDVQLIEQAMADRAQHRLERFRSGIGQRERAAGALVVSARVSQPVDDGVQDLSRPAAELTRPEGKASSALQKRPPPATSVTWSKRMKKSAISATMSG